MDVAFIYGLCDPETGEVRYVGKADNPKKRFQEHLSPCNCRDGSRRSRWVTSTLKKGLKPSLRILAEVPKADWVEHEREWIACLREQGSDLTNLTSGGDGLFEPGLEIREKISRKLAGHPVSEETRLKLREAATGRRPSEETRRKISESTKGRKKSAQHVRNLSAALTGRKTGRQTEETRLKRSRSMKGRTFSAEHCQKISEAKRGQTVGPMPAEQRQKISDRMTEWWASRKQNGGV